MQRRSPTLLPARVVRVAKLALFGAATIVVLTAGLSRPSHIEDIKGRPFAIDAMVQPLVDQTRQALDPDDPVLVLGLDQRLNQVNEDTILSNLIAEGIDTRVEPGVGLHYGTRRIIRDGWSGPMLWVTSGIAPLEPHGELLAEASIPGWSRVRFDELAAEVAEIARAAPELELQSWAYNRLPRYLAGWLDDDPCGVAQQIRDRDFPIASLPPGLLLVMYADLAVESPLLPASMQAEAAGLVGQGPIEVWRVERHEHGPVASDDLLRDGSQCPASLTPSQP